MAEPAPGFGPPSNGRWDHSVISSTTLSVIRLIVSFDTDAP
jgi:hypothetical protein